MRLEEKVAIITGGGSGIGRATCHLFAREGARLLVADINGQNAELVAQEVKKQGGVAEGIAVDVSQEEQAERMVARAVELWQRVDILVNNAVSFVRKEVQDATQADWHTVLGVNVLGISFCSKYAVRVMQKQNKGAIVNIGSINAIVALPDATTYNATKGAIVNMTKSMALGLAPYNIRVNCVCPGITRTPALEEIIAKYGLTYEAAEKGHAGHLIIKRFAKPEEIAAGILFVASDEASYVTGATVMVDGGYTAC
jgi:NAD(P)-dependent dehydrogenase (short-subunit alcohol dehydrogenase family)